MSHDRTEGHAATAQARRAYEHELLAGRDAGIAGSRVERRIDYGGIIPFGAEPTGPCPIRPGYHRAFDPELDDLVARLFGRDRNWRALVHRVVDEFEAAGSSISSSPPRTSTPASWCVD